MAWMGVMVHKFALNRRHLPITNQGSSSRIKHIIGLRDGLLIEV